MCMYACLACARVLLFLINTVISSALQALPNQATVDYPSFKLVIVGDGGTGFASSVLSL